MVRCPCSSPLWSGVTGQFQSPVLMATGPASVRVLAHGPPTPSVQPCAGACDDGRACLSSLHSHRLHSLRVAAPCTHFTRRQSPSTHSCASRLGPIIRMVSMADSCKQHAVLLVPVHTCQGDAPCCTCVQHQRLTPRQTSIGKRQAAQGIVCSKGFGDMWRCDGM